MVPLHVSAPQSVLDECSSSAVGVYAVALSLMTFNCHFPNPPLVHSHPSTKLYQMTLINGFSPPSYPPTHTHTHTPLVPLCPETLNIHISIISIFKSAEWITPDKTNSNYLCRDRDLFSVMSGGW